MTRTQLREQTFRILFLKEFHNTEELEEQIVFYEQSFQEWNEKDRNYILNRVMDIREHQKDIDTAIEQVSEGWKLERMGIAELSILRLAYYEMHMDEDIPVSVAINEAIELAKKFGGQEDASSFVNGILAKLV